jgi:hypothetical protein
MLMIGTLLLVYHRLRARLLRKQFRHKHTHVLQIDSPLGYRTDGAVFTRAEGAICRTGNPF